MMSNGWSIYVIALVVLNILGCLWLIWWTGKRRPGDPKPEDTSHVWDGTLTEYNKPMPKWWINLFYLTIAFSVGYLIWYPGMGAFAGTSGWSSGKEHDADKATQDKALAATFSKYDGQPIDVIARDPQAIKLGKAIFANTCATCHGATAQGAKGYPNLTDNIWQWGGTPDQIVETVLNGREGVMAPWEQALGPQGVEQVAVYVQSLSGQRVDSGLARAGKTQFETICVACHGVDGKGNQALGAPDLTDNYWLYGGDFETIKETIAKGRHGVMPAHKGLIGETRARVVAAYVYSLSHKPGEASAAAPPAAAAPVDAAAAAPAASAPAAAAIDDPTRNAKVYFDTGSAALSDADRSALATLAETMKSAADTKATISGFHDATGNAASNAELAKQRAGAVRDALVTGGVDAARIDMQKPVETTGGSDAREARRVEVHVQ